MAIMHYYILVLLQTKTHNAKFQNIYIINMTATKYVWSKSYIYTKVRRWSSD